MNQTNLDRPSTAEGSKSLKGRLRPWLMPAKRAFLALKQTAALIMRFVIKGVEKIIPPLGKKMRRWGWVWQPVFSHQYLNKFYEGKEDPFNFASPYEIGKYEHTLRLLEGKTFRRALEVGAAEGIFTEMLAPVCEELIGIEVADIAVERALQRLSHLPQVKFLQAALPNDMPDGTFDLIIVSDVLYYFPKDVLTDLLRAFERSLEPGGMIFSLHYRGRIGAPILGDEVHDLMKQVLSLSLSHEERVKDVGPNGDGYNVLIFEKSES